MDGARVARARSRRRPERRARAGVRLRAGRSLVVSSDGTAPWLATGDRAGHFGARAALGTPADGASGIDADLGRRRHARRRLGRRRRGARHDRPARAAARVRRSTCPPSARTASRSRSRRTRRSRSRTARRWARPTASTSSPRPRAAAFGSPATLDSGTAGIDSPDVAAGPGGAIAVTYRKIISRYRARVAVRPAGAARVRRAAERLGRRPGRDPHARRVRRRRHRASPRGRTAPRRSTPSAAPAATAFGDPVTLADGASSLSLVPTPQGGTAAAWAGNGVDQGRRAGARRRLRRAGDDRVLHARRSSPTPRSRSSPGRSWRASPTPTRPTARSTSPTSAASSTVIGYGRPGAGQLGGDRRRRGPHDRRLARRGRRHVGGDAQRDGDAGRSRRQAGGARQDQAARQRRHDVAHGEGDLQDDAASR